MMQRTSSFVVALAAAFVTVGCTRTVYLSETDANHYAKALGTPLNLETNPHATIVPEARNTPAPTTVTDPDRPIRYMSLAEAIAIALEQGNIGSQSALFPGIVNDNLLQFNGRFVGASDSIRVLALDPAVTGADIDSALSKFDARWVTSINWNKRDDAVGNILLNFQNGDNSTFNTGIYKFLPTGGVVGVTANMDYNFLTNPPDQQGQVFTNPSWRPRAQVVFEQPLLQGFGVEINQLTVNHPGATSINGIRSPGGGRTEGVLITRLRYDQSRTEFERNVNFMLLNVEYAYWNMYGAYFLLFSREQGLRQAFEAYKLNKARYEAGVIKQQDLEQTRAQYELFRAQRITAMGQVLDKERQLRGLLGMAIEDGQRIVASDTPTLAEFKPDWGSALQEMMSYRPEMILARQDLKYRQLDLLLQKNGLRPDLRFFANYDVNGIGTQLDGGPDEVVVGALGQQTITNRNALANLADNEFNSWTIGFRLDVPIGFRDAHAQVRTARLNLARSYFQLKDQERKGEHFLALQYRELKQYYAEIEAQRAQREANARQLELRFQEYRVGRGTLDVLLEAQRNFATSLSDEHTAIVNYNNRLCGFQFAKGTILQYNNVQVADGPLPAAAQVRAVEHQRARSIALELRERPGMFAPALPGGETAHEAMNGAMPSLPDLQKQGIAKPSAEVPGVTQ
ncbi:MAG: TolC family protein [Gemmataceae bacterium]|nr:TolC family protein [Gemmataceae bacterium]